MLTAAAACRASSRIVQILGIRLRAFYTFTCGGMLHRVLHGYMLHGLD